VRMPGMTGLDLMRELKRRDLALPTIVMTGHTDQHSVQRFEAYEPLGFLEKPFSMTALRALVERWRATFPPSASADV